MAHVPGRPGVGVPDQHALQAAYRLAHLYCDAGRWDDAEECIRFHAELPWQGNYFTTIYYRLSAAARLEAHRGDLDKSLELAEQALEITERCDLLNRRARVWLVARRGSARRGTVGGSRRRGRDGARALRGQGQRRRG